MLPGWMRPQPQMEESLEDHTSNRLSGQTLDQINDVLKTEQKKVGNSLRELNPRSFDLVRRAYAPSMFSEQDIKKHQSSFENVWEYIQNPKQMADLKKC